MKKLVQDSLRSFISAFIALAMVLLVANFVSAWSGPQAGVTPPDNNAAFPIHVGGSQEKSGSLTLFGELIANVVTGNTVEGGDVTATDSVCIRGVCRTTWPTTTFSPVRTNISQSSTCTGCTTGITDANAICAVTGIYNGGCDGGVTCSIYYSSGQWRTRSVSGGDCNASWECEYSCLDY